MKKSILFLMCIVVKFTYFKKYLDFFLIYFILSDEINNVIITLVTKLGLI
jgi:hypothetical protein